MATRTQLWDLLAVNLAFEPCLLLHGDSRIVAAGIASVATRACQALLPMDVLTKLLLSNFQRIRQSGVTIKTGVRGARWVGGLPVTEAHSEHNCPDQPNAAGCA